MARTGPGRKASVDQGYIQRESPTTTRVEVTARENLVEWDKEYAQQLLSRIVEKS